MVTPSTTLASNARMVPAIAMASSLTGFITKSFSTCSTPTVGCNVKVISPLGPLTFTSLPLTSTLMLAANAIGCFAILDMLISPDYLMTQMTSPPT